MKQWADMTPAQVEDAFLVRAQRDPKYALAWAVCRLANAQHRTADALGALNRIADVMDARATAERQIKRQTRWKRAAR